MIDLSNVPQIEWIRLVAYLIPSKLLEGVLQGKAAITNLPEGATIYKILMYRPDDCNNILSVWFEHPSFVEVPPGNIVELRWAQGEEIKDAVEPQKLHEVPSDGDHWCGDCLCSPCRCLN